MRHPVMDRDIRPEALMRSSSYLGICPGPEKDIRVFLWNRKLRAFCGKEVENEFTYKF